MNTQVSGSYRRPIYYDACSAVLQIAIMLTNKPGKELDSVLLEALLQQNSSIKVKGQPRYIS